MRSVLQFRLSTAMWLIAMAAIALGWFLDRQALEERIARVEAQLNPSARSGWSIAASLGEPDELDGSGSAAWCPATSDSQPEWLELTYPRFVTAKAIDVYETYATGAVSKVTAFDSRNREIVVWEGKDTTPRGKKGVLRVKVGAKVRTKRLKVYLDCPGTPGWNCIDAVGLTDSWGFTHWAESGNASSTYGSSINRSQVILYNR